MKVQLVELIVGKNWSAVQCLMNKPLNELYQKISGVNIVWLIAELMFSWKLELIKKDGASFTNDFINVM